MGKESGICYEPEPITPRQKIFRRAAARVFTSIPLFPTEIELYQETRSEVLDDSFPESLGGLDFEVDQGVLETIDELETEGRIFVLAIRHYSSDDPMRALGAAVRLHPVFEDRSVISPLEYRQYEKYKKGIKPLESQLAITVYPMVIQDTIDKAGFCIDGKEYYRTKDGILLEKGTGRDEYELALRSAIEKRNTILLPMDAGRRHQLFPSIDPKNRQRGEPLDLLEAVLRRDAAKVGVICVNMELPGVDKYQSGVTDGYNLGQTVRMIFGPAVRLEEMSALKSVFDTKDARVTLNTIGKTLLAERANGTYASIPKPIQNVESV